MFSPGAMINWLKILTTKKCTGKLFHDLLLNILINLNFFHTTIQMTDFRTSSLNIMVISHYSFCLFFQVCFLSRQKWHRKHVPAITNLCNADSCFSCFNLATVHQVEIHVSKQHWINQWLKMLRQKPAVFRNLSNTWYNKYIVNNVVSSVLPFSLPKCCLN